MRTLLLPLLNSRIVGLLACRRTWKQKVGIKEKKNICSFYLPELARHLPHGAKIYPSESKLINILLPVLLFKFPFFKITSIHYIWIWSPSQLQSPLSNTYALSCPSTSIMLYTLCWMNSSLTNHDSYPYSRQNYGRVKYKLPLWSWPERSTAHVRHNISTASNQNVWRWITATSFPFHHLDFPPISDFVTTVRINIELLRYARLPLVHWHGLQAGERYRLYKVNALYNSSAHALRFCQWSCSVTSWSSPVSNSAGPCYWSTQNTAPLLGSLIGWHISSECLSLIPIGRWSTACATAAYCPASQSKASWRWNSHTLTELMG